MAPQNPRQADAQIDALIARLGSGGPAQGPTTSLYGYNSAERQLNVFLGNSRQRMTPSPNAGEHGARPGWANTDKTMTAEEAVADFYSWDDNTRNKWGQKLYHAGLIKAPTDYDGMLNAWQSAVQEAGKFYTLGKRKITPWQVVDLFDTGQGPSRVGGPKTTTSTSVQLPSKGEAAAGIRKIWQDQLGRDPTAAELKKYTGLLTSTAKANPQTTTTHHTYDSTGAETNQSSTTSGGFDAGELLSGSAQADPEYGAYQASTFYYQALQNAIGAPG